jgi:hypothetical protein
LAVIKKGEIMKVTINEYADAIVTLLPVAMRDTGQSGRCAQVLLSAYNGLEFHLSIPELSCLDKKLYEACINVIRGRAELRIEPHTLLKDGDRIFESLYDRWEGLQVKNRGKVDCPRCKGYGVVYSNSNDEKGVPCEYCDRTGRVCRCKVWY